MGDPSAVSGRDRNLIWGTFTGKSTRVRKSDAEVDAAVTAAREAGCRYLPRRCQAAPARRRAPAGQPAVRQAVGGAGGQLHRPEQQTIDHPEVGPITLDCDVLTVAGSDLRLVVYTAEPSSPDANRLSLVQVIGLQKLSARDRPT
jgi:hypothetical protein